MDTLMAARNPNSNDYEGRFFDLLLKRMDKQDAKLDEIHAQTKRTNGRVTKLEKWRDSQKDSSQVKTTPFYKDPKVLQIATYMALGFLLLAAALANVDVTGLL